MSSTIHSTKIPFTDPRWTTLNTPTQEPTKSSDGTELSFPTEPTTDWWRIPSANRHSGLVYGFDHMFDVKKGFEVGVELRVDPQFQYDQAALFLQLEDEPLTWVKTGLEFEDDKLWAGAVVTAPWSDWSLQAPPPPSSPARFVISLQRQHLRIYLNGDMIREVNAFGDGSASKAFVGVMGCSPKGGGALVTFREFTLAQQVRGE